MSTNVRGHATIEITAGPDCRPAVALPSGRWVIGRDARCDIRLDDPTVAPFHAVAEVGLAARSVAVRSTTLIQGAPSGSGVVAPHRTGADHTSRSGTGEGVALSFGSSTAVIRASGDDPERVDLGDSRLVASSDGSDRRVVQRPFRVPRPPAAAVPCPVPPAEVQGPAATALVGAVVALVGALVVAVVIGRPMLAVFAVVAACTATVTWLMSWAVALRRRRNDARSWNDALRDLDALLCEAARRAAYDARATAPGLVWVLDAARTADAGDSAPGLWVGDPAADDVGIVVAVAVGFGHRRWSPPVEGRHPVATVGSASPHTVDIERIIDEHGELRDVPAAVSLRAGRATALVGSDRLAVARSMLVQAAWAIGPSRLRLVVLTDQADRWAWAARLPHVVHGGAIVDVGDAGSARGLIDVLSADTADSARPASSASSASSGSSVHGGAGERSGVATLLVVDRRSEPSGDDTVIRAAARRSSTTTLVIAPNPPGWVDEVVRLGVGGRVAHEGSAMLEWIDVEAVGASELTAAAAARVLEPLVDPDAQASAIPDRCTLLEVNAIAGGSTAPIDAERIVGWWNDAGADPPPVAVFGMAADGPATIDLDAEGPHVLLGGTTGSGKSELLRSLVVGLALRSPPDLLAFALFDFKGGAAFDACCGLPHVVGSVTDLDGQLARRAIDGLEAEVRRRAAVLRAAGASDLHEFRRSCTDPRPPLPRLVVVVDEFATLARELPDVLTSLIDLARRGRSMGLHLVLATQRPAGVISEEIRANTSVRIALRTEDESDSRDVIGTPDAAAISRRHPGRALRRSEHGHVEPLQVATSSTLTAEGGSELDQLVASVVAAHHQRGGPRAGRPWLPPLPDAVHAHELAECLAAGSGPTSDRVDAAASIAPVIGVVDDPAGQRRRPLTWAPSDGDLLVLGAAGSGCTSALLAVAAATMRAMPPDRLHLAVIDAAGDPRLAALESVAHSMGVVHIDDTERCRRLLDRLASGQRSVYGYAAGESSHAVTTLVLIDGLDVWWHRLTHPESADATDGVEVAAALRRMLMQGDDVGVRIVATARSDSLPREFVPADTWVGATDDPTSLRGRGWSGPPIPVGVPGRFGSVRTGLVAQVAVGVADLDRVAGSPVRLGQAAGPAPVRALPEQVDLDDLAELPEPVLSIGLGADDLHPVGPRLEPGRHLLVVGRPGSGVTTALRTIRARWRSQHPDGRVIDVVDADSAAAISKVGDEPVLVIVDDAHRVGDERGHLAAVVDGGEGPTASVVAGVRSDAYRAAYGHWTRTIAASEHGLALAAAGEPPTDVFGVTPPRRPLVAPRPGLGWLVDRGRCQALQVAVTSAPTPTPMSTAISPP